MGQDLSADRRMPGSDIQSSCLRNKRLSLLVWIEKKKNSLVFLRAQSSKEEEVSLVSYKLSNN